MECEVEDMDCSCPGELHVIRNSGALEVGCMCCYFELSRLWEMYIIADNERVHRDPISKLQD